MTNELEKYLRVFADPATPFSVTVVGEMQVRMVRDGAERQYTFRSNGTVFARHDGREHQGVPALLASSDFADIRTLRSTQRRLLTGRVKQNYMEPEGEIESDDAGALPLSFEKFQVAAKSTLSSNLSILLVDGPAGVGKTSLIERVVLHRSDPASSEPPLLHVTSSGKRLTSLNQELAHATQVLRAKFTFDQVPILAQFGVLQVAIDGFDELVDEGGYKDAWSALRDFLGQLRVGGPVLLAGRDTFFDQQSFRSRLAERIPELSLTTARLHPVSKKSAIAYLRTAGWTDEELTSADAREWFRSGSYQLRPFFLAQIATAGAWTDLRRAHGSPQSFIVSRFVEREAALISRMVPISIQEAEAGLWDFYGMVVEDMALQESDSVDVGYLALACETSFSTRLSDHDLQKLVHKAGSFGLLESDERGELRRFPHSELQSQFLARAIVRSLLMPGLGLPFLRRVSATMALTEAFADAIAGCPDGELLSVVAKLQGLHREQPFADRLVGNSIALLLACLTRPGVATPLEIQGGESAAARVFGAVQPAILDGVTLAQLDARSADLRAIRFVRCTIGTLTADDNTALGADVPTVGTLVLVSPTGAPLTVRTPAAIQEWIASHSEVNSASDSGGAGLRLVRYFDRLCRAFIRQHQIRNGPTDNSFFLIEDPFWEEVRPLLGTRLEVVEIGKSAAGPNDGFMRLRSPEELLRPPPDSEAATIRAGVVTRARELE